LSCGHLDTSLAVIGSVLVEIGLLDWQQDFLPEKSSPPFSFCGFAGSSPAYVMDTYLVLSIFSSMVGIEHMLLFGLA
jgi:hypothetical protein